MEVRSRMDTKNMCAKSQGLSLENGVDIWTFVGKTCVIYLVAFSYLVLV